MTIKHHDKNIHNTNPKFGLVDTTFKKVISNIEPTLRSNVLKRPFFHSKTHYEIAKTSCIWISIEIFWMWFKVIDTTSYKDDYIINDIYGYYQRLGDVFCIDNLKIDILLWTTSVEPPRFSFAIVISFCDLTLLQRLYFALLHSRSYYCVRIWGTFV